MTFLTDFLKDGAVGAFLQSNEKASADVTKESGPVETPKENQIINPLTLKKHPQLKVINAITNKVAGHQCGDFKNGFADQYLKMILKPDRLIEWTNEQVKLDSAYCTAFNRFWDKVLNDPNKYIKHSLTKDDDPKVKTWLGIEHKIII